MLTFDPDKNRENLAKHGIELTAAGRFDWEHAVIEEDPSAEYGEQRERATGRIDNALYVYIYTLRGDDEHAISLRKATKQEARRYAKELYG
jgi:uncharacterized DUF497 family protein